MTTTTTTPTTAAHALGAWVTSAPTNLATQRPGPSQSEARLWYVAAARTGASAARPPASRYPPSTMAAADEPTAAPVRQPRRTATHATTPARGTSPASLTSAP